MKNVSDHGTRGVRPAATKQPWIRPALQRMKAGGAEVGTRTTSDGAFSTS